MANKSSRIHILTECAIMVALATVLSYLKIWNSPYGGSVTVLSMAPIILLSVRRGVKVGLGAGFVYSLIQLLQSLTNVSYMPTAPAVVACIAFDYILPFTLLGLGGMFRGIRFSRNEVTSRMFATALGALTVTLIRYVCHVLSGALLWYELDLVWYADDPTHIVNRYGQWVFSMVYSAIYMVPEIIATTVGTPLIARALGAAERKQA